MNFSNPGSTNGVAPSLESRGYRDLRLDVKASTIEPQWPSVRAYLVSGWQRFVIVQTSGFAYERLGVIRFGKTRNAVVANPHVQGTLVTPCPSPDQDTAVSDLEPSK
jgi:hypothetical protein